MKEASKPFAWLVLEWLFGSDVVEVKPREDSVEEIIHG